MTLDADYLRGLRRELVRAELARKDPTLILQEIALTEKRIERANRRPRFPRRKRKEEAPPPPGPRVVVPETLGGDWSGLPPVHFSPE